MVKTKIPNWQSAADYEYIKTLTSQQLAWEFLRRSATYQKRYREIQLAPKGDRVEKTERVLKQFKIKWLVEPDLTPLPPQKMRKQFVANKLLIHSPIVEQGKRRIVISPVSATQVAVVFDLAVSIKKQEKVLRRRLKEALRSRIEDGVLVKPVANAKSKALYARYLRVMDATSVGASDDVIVGVLSKDVELKGRYSMDNFRKDKKLVKELIRAYRSIAFVDQK